jgi:membrane protein implicated in regulation of membrane protease activity
MTEFLNTLTGLEVIFFWSAFIGGVMFIIRLILQFVTGIGGELHHSDVGANATDNMGSSDISFRLLSLEGLVAFFTMFGTVGLALSKTTLLSEQPVIETLVAAGAGLATTLVIQKLFRFMSRLQSSGNIDSASAIGQEGAVYLTIPPGEAGKVQVVVQGRMSVFDAIATDKDATLKTGARVKVNAVTANGILVVESL